MALQSARAALQAHPHHTTLRFNLAQILLALPDVSAAFATLQTLFTLLNAPCADASALCDPYFPRGFDLFTVEMERLWSEYAPEKPEGSAALQTLLRWRVAEQLGEIALAQGECETAIRFARAATSARPDLLRTQALLARSLRALDCGEEAKACYRAALAEVPLDPALWNELATLLLETKQAERCQAFLMDVEAMLDGCPFYETWRPNSCVPAIRRPPSRVPRCQGLKVPVWEALRANRPHGRKRYTPSARFFIQPLIAVCQSSGVPGLPEAPRQLPAACASHL